MAENDKQPFPEESSAFEPDQSNLQNKKKTLAEVKKRRKE